MSSVELWQCSFDTASSARSELFGVLNRQEFDRASRIRSTAAQVRFVEARVLLRLVLGRMLDCDPRRVGLRQVCALCGANHGRIEVVCSDRELDVSVSHAGGCALVAIGTQCLVGVDVEEVSADYAYESLSVIQEQILTWKEQRALRCWPIGSADASAFFLRLWTMKEALAKIDGIGMLDPLTRFDVRWDQSDVCSVAFADPGRGMNAWWVAAPDVGARTLLASVVATTGRDAPVGTFNVGMIATSYLLPRFVSTMTADLAFKRIQTS